MTNRINFRFRVRSILILFLAAAILLAAAKFLITFMTEMDTGWRLIQIDRELRELDEVLDRYKLKHGNFPPKDTANITQYLVENCQMQTDAAVQLAAKVNAMDQAESLVFWLGEASRTGNQDPGYDFDQARLTDHDADGNSEYGSWGHEFLLIEGDIVVKLPDGREFDRASFANEMSRD